MQTVIYRERIVGNNIVECARLIFDGLNSPLEGVASCASAYHPVFPRLIISPHKITFAKMHFYRFTNY